jgi:hypothetical protein
MPTMAAVLSYTPTVLFWSAVIFLVLSEFVGKLATSLRPRCRVFAGMLIFGLGMWYAAEAANHVALTSPDFTPWSHFVSNTPTP